jgi:hypothetical protein
MRTTTIERRLRGEVLQNTEQDLSSRRTNSKSEESPPTSETVKGQGDSYPLTAQKEKKKKNINTKQIQKNNKNTTKAAEIQKKEHK